MYYHVSNDITSLKVVKGRHRCKVQSQLEQFQVFFFVLSITAKYVKVIVIGKFISKYEIHDI